MINKLTKEQEKPIPEYREKFRKMALNTEPCDRKAAEQAVKDSYKYLNLDEPQILWFDGPNDLVEYVENTYGKDKLKDFQYGWSSNFEAYWISFYCFINEVLPVNKTPLADIARRIAEECGVYYTFDTHVFMLERPKTIKFNQENRADADGGPYLEFRDGYKLYAIDGVVSSDIDSKVARYALIPANEINIKEVLQIENVDLRRAVLKKVGPGRLLEELNAKHLDSVELDVPIDQIMEGLIATGMYSKEDRPALIKHLNSVNTNRYYDLYELDFGEFKGKYLKMENPSINEIHIEGVSNECMTVEDALRFRDNKTNDSPAFSAVLS